MTWGALVMGSTHTLFEPGGGGVLGLRPGICHEAALSCYPSFLDTMAAEKGLPKIVSFCGNEVCVYVCMYGRANGLGWGSWPGLAGVCLLAWSTYHVAPNATHTHTHTHRNGPSSCWAGATSGCTRAPSCTRR